MPRGEETTPHFVIRQVLSNRISLDLRYWRKPYETFRQLALEPQNRVVWVVPHGVTPKRSLARRYETALVWSKGPTAVFNPNAAATPQRQPGKRSYKAHNYGELTGRPLGAWPSGVWTDLPSVRYGHPEKTDHPAQFPLGLAMRATLLYTLPGQLVIDPFSGSGTVEEAARRTGRAFTGADLYYEDIRTARLANVEMDKSTPLPGISDEMVALWQAEAVRRDTPARPTTRAEQRSLIDEFFPDPDLRDAA